jgi:MoxR-like ATPase
MIAFIDDHRGELGVEPICKHLPIAPSTYYDHLAKRADPDLRSDRARRDVANAVSKLAHLAELKVTHPCDEQAGSRGVFI